MMNSILISADISKKNCSLNIYNIELPLEYSKYSPYEKEHDSEYIMKIVPELSWKLDIIVHLCNGNNVVNELPESFTIGVKNSEDNNEPRFMCVIQGYISENEYYAKISLYNLVEKLCKHLTFELSKCNCNIHRFQPRIEPNWDKAKWCRKRYEPLAVFLEKNRYQQGSNIVGFCAVYPTIDLKVYVETNSRIDISKTDYKSWLEEDSEAIEFMLDEYCLALGQESVTSKFFHLFSIIEFIEHEYVDHAGAMLLFSEEEKAAVIQAVKANINDNNDNDNNIKNRVNILASSVGNIMKKATNIGRSEKLKNILAWLDVEEIQIFDDTISITKDFLTDIIDLRNQSFHGTRTMDGTYQKSVLYLFCICKKVIESAQNL